MGRATRADAIQIGSVDVTHFSLRHHVLTVAFPTSSSGKVKELTRVSPDRNLFPTNEFLRLSNLETSSLFGCSN